MKNTRLKEINANQQFMLEFYETYQAFLYHCAWKYTQSRPDCEDIIQDTMVRLLRNMDTLRRLTEKQIFTYLSLTVRSVYADHARLKSNQEVPTEDEVLGRLKTGQSHEEWAAVQWDVELLRQRLPEKDWRLLELKYITGCSDAEIAAELGCGAGSVRTLMVRARQKARLLLSEPAGKEG